MQHSSHWFHAVQVQQQDGNDVALGAAADTLGLEERSGIDGAVDGPQAIADVAEVTGAVLPKKQQVKSWSVVYYGQSLIMHMMSTLCSYHSTAYSPCSACLV